MNNIEFVKKNLDKKVITVTNLEGYIVGYHGVSDDIIILKKTKSYGGWKVASELDRIVSSKIEESDSFTYCKIKDLMILPHCNSKECEEDFIKKAKAKRMSKLSNEFQSEVIGNLIRNGKHLEAKYFLDGIVKELKEDK